MSQKAYCLLLLTCLAALPAASAAASAATPGPAISHSEAVKALRAAESVFTTPLASGGAPTREATPILRDLAVALPALGGANRRRGKAILTRPTDRGSAEYFGPEAKRSPICDASFCVHWTNRGKNAPSSPQFVNEVIAATKLSHSVENGELGWREPKSDDTLGSRRSAGRKGQVDVYITDLGPRLYGYATPDPHQDGSRTFAYLVLDNSYTGFPSPPIPSMQVTVAHEYNHILHFNYDTFEDLWMFESTAVWAEEQVYPEINDYLNYVKSFAGVSRLPLTTGDFQVYSEGVWNHWLDARYGPDVVRGAWEASSDGVRPAHQATAAYDKSIRAHGGQSFSREFGSFAAGTAEWNSSPSFPDAAAYPDIRRKGMLTPKPTSATLNDTSYRLVNVAPNAAPTVTLDVKAPHGVASAIALVGRGPLEAPAVTTVIRQVSRGGRVSVTLPNPAGFSRITAVIANTDATTRRGRYVSDGSKYEYKLGK
ncbi:MAG: MXAN_6640 family putative metalloprotease [Solirubrobacterales bacterium]